MASHTVTDKRSAVTDKNGVSPATFVLSKSILPPCRLSFPLNFYTQSFVIYHTQFLHAELRRLSHSRWPSRATLFIASPPFSVHALSLGATLLCTSVFLVAHQRTTCLLLSRGSTRRFKDRDAQLKDNSSTLLHFNTTTGSTPSSRKLLNTRLTNKNIKQEHI